MTDFAELFRRSNGKPIKYKGRTVVAWDQLPIGGENAALSFRFVSTNSEWRQGMSLKTDGVFDFGLGERIKGGVLLWEESAPKKGSFHCRSRNGFLDVKNIWDEGRGCAESWIHGAAMWIEEIPNGRRYHCNDGHFDDDFDDIVFELTFVRDEDVK